MSEMTEKPNKNAGYTAKIPNKFFTRIINGERRISHFEVCRLFGLNPVRVVETIDQFSQEDGQGDTVFITGTLRWMDATAFYSLHAALDLPEALSQAILAALGYFDFQPVEALAEGDA